MSKVNPLTLVVTVDVPAQMDKQFNEWYNKVHVPEVLNCPGWLSARRFQAVEGGPKYMALYQLEDIKARHSDELRRVAGFADFSAHIINHNSALYQQIYPVIKE